MTYDECVLWMDSVVNDAMARLVGLQSDKKPDMSFTITSDELMAEVSKVVRGEP